MYQVFISFKNLDSEKNATADSKLAESLFQCLTNKGIKTFYSNYTLETMGISQYKNAIDDALDQCCILIVVGTSIENIESKWVRYEWDSFYNDILSGLKPKGHVFSYVDGINTNSLPRTLRQQQSFNTKSHTSEDVCSYIINCLSNNNCSKDNLPLYDDHKSFETIIDCEEKYYTCSLNDLYKYDLSLEQVKSEIKEHISSSTHNCASSNIDKNFELMMYNKETSRIIIDSFNNIVGYWCLIALNKDTYDLAIKGKLDEELILLENTEQIDFSGIYYGYFLLFGTVQKYRTSKTIRLVYESFAQQLTLLAKTGIFFREFCTVSETFSADSVNKKMGFSYLCPHSNGGKVFKLDLTNITDNSFWNKYGTLIELYKHFV